MTAWTQILLAGGGLFVLAAPPVALVWFLDRYARKIPETRSLRVGNTLSTSEERAPEAPLLTPLVHHVRTTEEGRLRHLMLGLRTFPIEATEALLKRFRRSSDAELQIYSQSVRQEAMESLQADYLQLKIMATPDQPALMASNIAAGLRILDAPFTPETEHAGLLAELQKAARSAMVKEPELPRLLFEVGRVWLRGGALDEAGAVFARLPENSPLREKAEALLAFRRAIALSSAEAPNDAPAPTPTLIAAEPVSVSS